MFALSQHSVGATSTQQRTACHQLQQPHAASQQLVARRHTSSTSSRCRAASQQQQAANGQPPKVCLSLSVCTTDRAWVLNNSAWSHLQHLVLHLSTIIHQLQLFWVPARACMKRQQPPTALRGVSPCEAEAPTTPTALCCVTLCVRVCVAPTNTNKHQDPFAERTVYNDGPVDKLFIKLFTQKMADQLEGGWCVCVLPTVLAVCSCVPSMPASNAKHCSHNCVLSNSTLTHGPPPGCVYLLCLRTNNLQACMCRRT